MSGDLTARDDLVQQLADHLLASAQAPVVQRWGAERFARAVLASGLVVPTSDVLRLADAFDAPTVIPADEYDQVAAELRALTQQEAR